MHCRRNRATRRARGAPCVAVSIRGFPPAHCELRQLRKLTLWHAALGELPDALGKLAALEVLELENCGLTRAPDVLGKLTAPRISRQLACYAAATALDVAGS